MEITEFLEARIAEDEAAAEQLTHIFHGPGTQMYVAESWIQSPLKKKRFLAECAAKRAIMSRHASCDDVSYGDASTCPEIRTLAAIYSDHPDYQPEWAVADS
jgi:hypothetical protein